MATPEQPPPAEPKVETAPQAPADSAAATAAQARQAEQGEQRKERSAAGPPDPAEAEAVLAQLGIEVKVAPKEGQPPLTLEKIGEALAKAKPEQLIALEDALSTAVTDQEKKALQEKFDANGLLDWKKLVQTLGEGKLSVRELVVMSAILETNPPSIWHGVDKAPLDQASQRINTLKQALEKQLKPQYAPEQVDALFKKPEYQTAYAAFIKDGDKEKFLAAITNEEDRKVIEWAITADPTIAEKTAVGKKFESLIAKKDAAAIAEAVGKGEMNYREGMVAKALLDDLQRVAESQDKIPDELKGLGFMALLEKLIEKLTKLMEKLTGQIDKAFAKKSDQFPTSPIGGDQKFIIEKAAEGVNLKAEKAGLDVKYAVPGKGKVAEVGADYVKIEAGKGFIIYKGIKPAVTKGTEVSEGTIIGRMNTDVLNFQMIGEDKNPIPATRVAELLGKYAKKPPEANAETPALNVTQPPIALTGDQKLNVSKNFGQTGSNGIEITAAKDTAVVMMGDGIITTSENGTIEVNYKDGKVVKFTGLKNDASLHAANANVVVKAGEQIGAIGAGGVLGIQVIENGKQIDPAALLANYLPAANPPANPNPAAPTAPATAPTPPTAPVPPPAAPPSPPTPTAPA